MLELGLSKLLQKLKGDNNNMFKGQVFTTGEMFNIIKDNKKLQVKSLKTGKNYKVDCDGYFVSITSGKKMSPALDDKWEIVSPSVSFDVAQRAWIDGKTVKVTLNGYDQTFSRSDCRFTPSRDQMRSGTWYIL